MVRKGFADPPGPTGEADRQPLQAEIDEPCSAGSREEGTPTHGVSDETGRETEAEEEDDTKKPEAAVTDELQNARAASVEKGRSLSQFRPKKPVSCLYQGSKMKDAAPKASNRSSLRLPCLMVDLIQRY